MESKKFDLRKISDKSRLKIMGSVVLRSSLDMKNEIIEELRDVHYEINSGRIGCLDRLKLYIFHRNDIDKLKSEKIQNVFKKGYNRIMKNPNQLLRKCSSFFKNNKISVE